MSGYLPTDFAADAVTHFAPLVFNAPLGTLVVTADLSDATADQSPDPQIHHLPFLLAGEELHGHVARANPLANLTNAVPCIVVFTGSQGYVSPNYYPSKQHEPRVVPTWNYAVAHVRGTLHLVQEQDWKQDLVTALTRQEEAKIAAHRHHLDSGSAVPWQVSDAPPDFLARMLRGIVGVKVTIDAVVCKFKLSQNRSAADVAGVVHGNRESGNAALADFMDAYADRDANPAGSRN